MVITCVWKALVSRIVCTYFRWNVLCSMTTATWMILGFWNKKKDVQRYFEIFWEMISLLHCCTQVMFNKIFICFASVLDKMLFVTPSAFLLRCLSHGYIYSRDECKARYVEKWDPKCASAWYSNKLARDGSCHLLFIGPSLNTTLFVMTLKAGTVINQYIGHRKCA